MRILIEKHHLNLMIGCFSYCQVTYKFSASMIVSTNYAFRHEKDWNTKGTTIFESFRRSRCDPGDHVRRRPDALNPSLFPVQDHGQTCPTLHHPPTVTVLQYLPSFLIRCGLRTTFTDGTSLRVSSGLILTLIWKLADFVQITYSFFQVTSRSSLLT